MSSTNKNTTSTNNKTTTTTNNNKGGKKQQGKKQFYQNSPAGGANRGDRGDRGDVIKKKKTSKTLFIGKIFMEDISRTDVSAQLIEHRVNYLMSVLEKYGEVEHYQNNIEANNYVLVTYKTRETAERVLKKLRSKTEMENLMEQIKVQLGKNKIPASVCPNLVRYKFDWSDKPARASITKNAYSGKKVPQKDEETKEVANGTEKPKTTTVKKVKKPKKKYQKKDEEPEHQEEEKVVEPEKKVEEPKILKKVEEKRTVDAENLRREADKAKLKDELEYLSKQLKNVEAEINAENKRCKDRDVRIQNLEEDLRRVDQAKSRLERQLANERNWKKLNQDTVSQLQRELEHIRQEQQSANLRLNQSESDLDQTQPDDRFY